MIEHPDDRERREAQEEHDRRIEEHDEALALRDRGEESGPVAGLLALAALNAAGRPTGKAILAYTDQRAALGAVELDNLADRLRYVESARCSMVRRREAELARRRNRVAWIGAVLIALMVLAALYFATDGGPLGSFAGT